MAKSDELLTASSSGVTESIRLPTLKKQSIFFNWKFRIHLFLEQKGVVEVLQVRLKKKVKKRDDFKKKDSEAKLWIVQSVDDELLDVVRNCTTAQQMIMKLEAHFQRKTAFSKYHLKKQLLTMRLDTSESLQSHFKKFDQLISKLEAIGCKLDESDKVCHLLLTLPEEYKVIITSLDKMLSMAESGQLLQFVKPQLLESERKLKYKEKEETMNCQEQDFTSRVSATLDTDVFTVKLEQELAENSVAITINDEPSQAMVLDGSLHSPWSPKVQLDMNSAPGSPQTESCASDTETEDAAFMKEILSCRVVLQDISHRLLCTECNKWCFTKVQLQRHKETHTAPQSNDDGSVLCIICKQSFSNNTQLENHMDQHDTGNNSRQDSAEACEQIKSIKPPEVIPHEHCPEVIASTSTQQDRATLEKRIKIKLKPKQMKPFQCSLCDKSFKLNGSLQNHILKRHCEFNADQETSSGTEIKCYICPDNITRMFTKKTTLGRHIIRTHGKKNFTYFCEICGSEYACYSTLTYHANQTHSKIAPHECSICQEKFTLSIQLLHHKSLVHKGEDLFKCSVCRQTFKYESLFKQHQIIHALRREWPITDVKTNDPVKNYMCIICNTQYVEKKLLMQHISMHHGKNQNNCDICSESFNVSSALFDHIQMKHRGEKPFACAMCGIGYPTKLQVAFHHANMHATNLDQAKQSEPRKKIIKKEVPTETYEDTLAPTVTNQENSAPKYKIYTLGPGNIIPQSSVVDISPQKSTELNGTPKLSRTKNITLKRPRLQNQKIIQTAVGILPKKTTLLIPKKSFRPNNLKAQTMLEQPNPQNVITEQSILNDGTCRITLLENATHTNKHNDDSIYKSITQIDSQQNELQNEHIMPNERSQENIMQNETYQNIQKIKYEIKEDHYDMLSGDAEQGNIWDEKQFESITKTEPCEEIIIQCEQDQNSMEDEPNFMEIDNETTQLGTIMPNEPPEYQFNDSMHYEEIVQDDFVGEIIIQNETDQNMSDEPYQDQDAIMQNESNQDNFMPNEAYQDSIMPNEAYQDNIMRNEAYQDSIMPNEAYQDSFMQNKITQLRFPIDNEQSSESDPLQEKVIVVLNSLEENDTTDTFQHKVINYCNY